MVFGELINRQTSQTKVSTMKVISILNDFLTKEIPSMHKIRKQALLACVHSVVRDNELTVTAMGRGIDSNAREKHAIKRSDRLCSNINLYREKNHIYAAMCKHWIPATARPVILIDWSDLDECKNAFLISATLAYDGRPITLYQEVHGINTKEKPTTHKTFMETLKSLLPKDCRPIIVTDAGFKVPWFKLVLSLGWDYVGRSRKPNFFSLNGENWQSINVLFKKATSTAKCFKGLLTKYKQYETTFVLYKNKAKGRQKLNKQGKRAQSKKSNHHAESGKEPWLLVTSLAVTSKLAKRVVEIYKKRMEIEEGYRDMKSEHYGLGFNASLSYKVPRIAILMLIAALAAILLLIIGTAAEQAGLARHYQANTVKHRRVLSLHFLGRRVVKNSRFNLTVEDIQKAILHMQTIILTADRRMWKSKVNGIDQIKPSLQKIENCMCL